MKIQNETIVSRLGLPRAAVMLLTAQVILGCGPMDEEELQQEIRSLVPTDQKTTVSGTHFAWSSAGPVADMVCVQIVEPSDLNTWSDNYFCASEDIGMVWSSAGPAPSMQCTQILESADPHTWFDNYLCLPEGSPFEFTWDSAGGRGAYFVRWLEAADPATWDDNYLTVARKFRPPFMSEQVQGTERLDEVYYLQPHNSYDYGPTLTSWLDAGFRSLELDVIDREDWENHALGPYVAHDMDPHNVNCSAGNNDRLGHCLTDILNWLDAHPNTRPLMLYVDMKASWDPLNAWKSDEVADLDHFIGQYLGDRLYSYQDLLDHLQPHFQSDYRQTLKEVGWPTVESLEDRIIVVLTGGQPLDVNNRMENAYLIRGSSLNSILCPDVDAADPEEFSGAIDSISAENSKNFFCGNVAAGDHYQVTANRASEYKQLMHLWGSSGDFSNTDFAAAWIAMAHGVSEISVDVSDPASAPNWMSDRIFHVGRSQSLPGYFSIMSHQDPSLCLTGANGYSNGSTLRLEHCNANDAQQFVYTAEGQLRPKGHNQYCVDFSSGSADNGDDMHLWDCDGGNSEKWAITNDGHFMNRDNGWTHCMDVPGGNAQPGQHLEIHQCHGGDNQTFHLEAFPGWNQSSF